MSWMRRRHKGSMCPSMAAAPLLDPLPLGGGLGRGLNPAVPRSAGCPREKPAKNAGLTPAPGVCYIRPFAQRPFAGPVATLERCPSGRRSSTGNAVMGLNPFEGSNPSLSVSFTVTSASSGGYVVVGVALSCALSCRGS